MTYLCDLAEKYGTDKGPSGHNYTPYYEEYLQHRRFRALTLLELGVWKGASLRMWRDYFPSATIVGIDNKDRRVRIDGVDTHICSQENETGLYQLQWLYDD